MQVEVSTLVMPITEDRPCGEDLDETQPLVLAGFDSYRLFGQMAPWPKDKQPDWREIRDRSLEVLAQSRDLRVLAHLAAAALHTEGLGAFGQTLATAKAWLSTWWDQAYPRIDEDAILRRNALNCLADRVAVADGLRRAPLLVHRQLGTYSIRDIEIAQGHLTPAPDEPPRDASQLAALLAAIETDSLQVIAGQVTAAIESFRAIEATMRDHGGSEAVPDFSGPLQLLSRTKILLDGQLATRVPADLADAAAGASADGGRAAVARAAGAIGTRDEALRTLDAVAAFFRKTEPSSPIPLFIERAKRLVGKDFLAVLEDVIPDSVAQAKSVGGVRDAE
ncbi:MAG TPA: type VI secretion system protein TssA [Steroidobacteraceae bacterium]|jgi:type VI secretion system protein ImpA|nr:type VI secretion system protein TssA [Steroidobacteraceae bacterium]